MEIKIENGRITIIGATRDELKAFSEFVYGGIPYEVTTEAVAEIKTDTNVSVAVKETTTVSKPRSKGKKPTREDGYLSVAEFAKKYNRSTSTIHFHLGKGLPHKKVNDLILINEEGGKAYLAAHSNPIAQDAMKKRHQISDFAAWKKRVESQIVGKRKFDNPDEKRDYINAILEKVYYKMRSTYSVCWEQEKRDYYREKHYMPQSTLRLCYWLQYEKESNDKYEKLFESILSNMLQEKEKEVTA